MNPPIPGTVIIYGPHFSRTGFGLLARGWALALHAAGCNVRVVPVDCNDPDAAGDLNDCDLYLLRSLQFTPVNGPVTAIFAYVPTYVWPKVSLPEPHLRIMLTTFDSSANAATPPFRLIYMCNQMDQVWVANKAEEKAWIRGGLDPQRVHSFNWAHDWIDNPRLGKAEPKPVSGKPFRFLHISLFLPRRRLDVLIRAFFEEFRTATDAELYLKMSYPSWHPVPGKPKRDLRELIDRLQNETGSQARVIVDEALGTRLELAKLIDSCDVYVSPDTTNTAPVSEAIIRNRPVIITDGWGTDLPPQAWVIPNGTQRIEITPEMAEYMPHQRGASFPVLDKGLVRQALRRFYDMADAERTSLVQAAAQYMRERYSLAAVAPAGIAAIQKGWAEKRHPMVEAATPTANSKPEAATRKPLNINWCGLQLFHGRIPKANRGISAELMRRGHQLSIQPGNGPFHIEELELKGSDQFQELARRFFHPLSGPADFTVSSRWHPVFKEMPAAHQILANTWWSGAIPTDWVKPISEHVTEVWAPSQFVRNNFIAGGVADGQVKVIPLGFDPAVFHPDAAAARLRTRKKCKFLYVGETTQRKGFDILLNAYLKTFTAKDDVCLVVKDIDCEDYYGRLAAREAIRQCQANPNCPEIEYLETMVGEAELAGIYRACDCFVQPARTSSFGMAALEAMACGLPVLTTHYGGILEFCNDQTAILLPAREIRSRPKLVGHWKVDGDQVMAEVKFKELQARMEQAYRNPSTLATVARLGREHVHAKFTWKQTVDRIAARFDSLQGGGAIKTESRVQNVTLKASPVQREADNQSPTVMVFAPFYNRSGYGVAARALVTGLNGVGAKIRIVPTDQVEPGIDDCDMAWLKSLEQTPLTAPLIAIFFHVPSPNWLQVQLPPGSLRVMFTTFDGSAQGNLPPAAWVSICNQMDQVWLMTAKEAAVFAKAGVAESKIKVLACPHPWISNPALPPVIPASKTGNQPFRFFSLAMFQPRRRWDTLIEAFLTEFENTADVELYLKVNYPLWHPVPGQPQRDLRELIDSLRARTGSTARITLDDTLDTRSGICRLMDSCDAYVSTDTSITAPVGEAFVRGKIAVIPDGYGVALPYCEGALVIPVDPGLSGPMAEAMLQYQPHHRGTRMPLLCVEDVRRTMRAAFELPKAQREQMGQQASLVMEWKYGPANTVPEMIKALDSGLQEKIAAGRSAKSKPAATAQPVQVAWEGSFLDLGSLSHVNREISRELNRQQAVHLTCVGKNILPPGAAPAPELVEMARRLQPQPAKRTQVTVRHAWPPSWEPPATGAWVLVQPWEFGALPEEWVRQLRRVDEAWVPSEYVRRVYVDSGVESAKVKVVPNGVDAEKFKPSCVPRPLATRKSFKFLFVGGTIHRKGPDVLLEAYLKNFCAADDVCLVIKDFGGKGVYAGQTLESRIKAAQLHPDAPEILYLNEEMPPDALPGLYTACDCLVHPYRGEGFGLPVLEAMACGLPVVVTGGGSTDDFATDEFAYRIPAKRVGIGSEISGMRLARDGWLLEPDAAALGDRMKWVAAHREEARALGRSASDHVRREWTWECAAQIAAGRLQELAARKESEAAALTQRRSRKAASITVPEAARLGSLQQATELLREKEFRSAWNATLAAMTLRPFHCEAWLLLAEIAKAAGDYDRARLCAERARKMAPNWRPVKQFLKSHSGKAGQSIALPSLPESPAAPRLSVCLITRNEERFLEQCLRSVADLAHQIVVVDTGSTDRTVEIARKFNADVHEFKWIDDFSAARNEALKFATGDWVLVLDADEELPSEHRTTLAKEMQAASVMAYRLPIIDKGREAEGCSYVPRLFRNAPGLFFVGRVHEQIFSSLEVRREEWGLENRLGKTSLLHHGYTEEVVASRDKIARNLRLLEMAIEEMPNEPNLLMSLGLELVRSGRLEEGLEQYWEAFHAMAALPAAQIVPELRETLLTQLATHLMAAKQPTEIVRLFHTPLARSAGFTASQHFLIGLACLELKEHAEAAEQMRQCLAKRDRPALSPANREIFKAGPNHCLAMALAALKQDTAAEKAFAAALKDDPSSRPARFDFARFRFDRGDAVEALKMLHELVGEKSDDLLVWQFGGQIALGKREFLEFAQDWTGEAIKLFPQHPGIALQRAEALLLSQQTEQALLLWTRAHSPNSARHLAALVLCETLAGRCERRFAPADEALVSQEFLKWYRLLLSAGAGETVTRLNVGMNSLRAILPSFVKLWETAMKEAGQAIAA